MSTATRTCSASPGRAPPAPPCLDEPHREIDLATRAAAVLLAAPARGGATADEATPRLARLIAAAIG